jgi:hypothetical protein
VPIHPVPWEVGLRIARMPARLVRMSRATVSGTSEARLPVDRNAGTGSPLLEFHISLVYAARPEAFYLCHQFITSLNEIIVRHRQRLRDT